MSNWFDISEMCFGLAIMGKIDLPNPEHLSPPYDLLGQEYKNGTTIQELIIKHGIGAIQSALDRAEHTNGVVSQQDWGAILFNVYSTNVQADIFDSLAKQLRRGDEIDPTILKSHLNSFGDKNESDMVLASTIDTNNLNNLQPFGFKPIDMWIGGQVVGGTNLVIGWPKSGKTQLAIRIAGSNLITYPNKQVLFISTEISKEQVVDRMINMGFGSVLDRLWIVAGYRKVEAIATMISTMKDLSTVIVDLVDDIALAHGAISEPIMAHVHTTLAQIALANMVPIWVFGQPTIAEEYARTIRPDMARYARTIASAKCSVFYSIYNPKQPYAPKRKKDLSPTTRTENVIWLYCWVCRSKLAPLQKNDVEEITKRFPFVMPVYNPSGQWWDGSRVIEKLPLSILNLEQGGF